MPLAITRQRLTLAAPDKVELLLSTAMAYPAVALLLFALYKWRDDGWTPTKSTFIIMAMSAPFFLVVAINRRSQQRR